MYGKKFEVKFSLKSQTYVLKMLDNGKKCDIISNTIQVVLYPLIEGRGLRRTREMCPR